MLSSTSRSRRQRGLSLIESLVAIFVTALGILGILGVQMRTLSDTQTTLRRAQAIRLIEDLGERMKVHPNALAVLEDYTDGWTSTPPTAPAATNCATVPCDATQLAAYDLAEWKRAVQRALPLGDASVFLAPGEGTANNRRHLGVIISWRENERDDSDAYKDELDATQLKQEDGTLIAGTDAANACPANRSCHLQYIPVAARCAPYFAGGGPVQYFCAGS